MSNVRIQPEREELGVTVQTAAPKAKSAFSMSAGQRRRFLRFAQGAVLTATVINGAYVALQVAALAPFPGTETSTFADKVMRALSFLAVFTVLGTTFKALLVPIVGPMIERKLETNRPVKLRHVFNRDIRWTAIGGGVLNAIYAMWFVFLAPYVAPTALAASRACIVLALVVVEGLAHALPRGGRMVYVRLALSVVVTLAGAAIVIFADGFDLFKNGVPDDMKSALWITFILLIGPGNFLLAIAELLELHGVQDDESRDGQTPKKPKTAPAVYTLARFMAYSGTACFTALAWGLTHNGGHMFVGVVNMVLHRWYYLVPLSIFWALTDLIRICVKTVVPATYMYAVMLFMGPMDAILQSLAKIKAPDIYIAVPDPRTPEGLHFIAVCICGGIVIGVGNLLWPHEKGTKDQLPVNPGSLP